MTYPARDIPAFRARAAAAASAEPAPAAPPAPAPPAPTKPKGGRKALVDQIKDGGE